MKNIFLTLFTLLTFVAIAQTPRDLDDLIDMKGQNLDSEMQDRGYRFIKNKIDGNIINTFWYNDNKNKCVKCSTANGRVVAIVNSNECNQGGRYNYSTSTDYSRNDNYYSNNNGHHNNNSNYEYYDDLVYKPSKYAYDKLNQRGFAEVKKVSDGGNTYKLFYNNRTRQCIKTTSRDEKITSIHPSSNCRM
jgi:hypothetical protein